MLSISADTVVVPLASEDDARRTCAALEAAVDDAGRIVLLHVIEKAGGAPDKASVEQREGHAEAIFAAGRDALKDGRGVETEVHFATDVGDGIIEAAVDLDADLLAFQPRKAGLLTRLLTGTTARDLVTKSPIPVVVLPSSNDEAEGDEEEEEAEEE